MEHARRHLVAAIIVSECSRALVAAAEPLTFPTDRVHAGGASIGMAPRIATSARNCASSVRAFSEYRECGEYYQAPAMTKWSPIADSRPRSSRLTTRSGIGDAAGGLRAAEYVAQACTFGIARRAHKPSRHHGCVLRSGAIHAHRRDLQTSLDRLNRYVATIVD